MKTKIIRIITLVFILSTICMIYGCKSKTKQTETTVDRSDDKFDETELKSQVVKFINNISKPDGLSYIEDELNMTDELTTELNVVNSYYCDNAYYIQIETLGINYMYRFQFNSNNKICSYIAYYMEDTK